MARVDRQTLLQIKRMFDDAGIPIHVWLPIMHLESGGNPRAHNPRGEDSRGLFQINIETAPEAIRGLDLFNPLVNVRAILTRDWLGNRHRLTEMLKLENPADQAAFQWRRGIRPYWTAQKEANIRHLSTRGLNDLVRQYFGEEGVDIQTPPARTETREEEREDEEGFFDRIIDTPAEIWENFTERISNLFPRFMIIFFGSLILIGVLILIFLPDIVSLVFPKAGIVKSMAKAYNKEQEGDKANA